MAHHPAHGAINLPIRGMTCRSCELLLEESLGAVPGVKHVRVRRTRSSATIVIGDQPVDEASLERAVEEAGYSVGHEHVPWFSRDIAAYFHVFLGIAILGIVALSLALGGFSLPSFGTSSTSMTFSVALVVGLTAGFSTCMALIGGLVLAVSARFSKDNHHLTRWQKFQPHLAFNTGRVVGFGILGGSSARSAPSSSSATASSRCSRSSLASSCSSLVSRLPRSPRGSRASRRRCHASSSGSVVTRSAPARQSSGRS
ncbi:MAG: cation transporter [Holophagales bacterium]|nr:cation transporter [Holophagales bacterium]